MSFERFTMTVAVYLVLIKDDKVLLLRRFNTGWADGSYSFISGHVDGNEPVSSAMCREAKEEAGINVDPKNLKFEHVMHRTSDKEYIDFFFTVSDWEGEPYNAEPNKCDELKWFPIDEVPDNTLPYIKQVLIDIKENIKFSEVGWERK